MEKCIHCGHEGDDVDFRVDYIGGKGMETIGPLCQDRMACWRRWDEQNGLIKVEREKVVA